jgi:O-antigen ligase
MRTRSIPSSSRTALSLASAAAGAVVFGWSIFGGNWIYLAPLIVAAVVPVVVRWPVQASLGIYAFLIPFDPILALGGETTGTTLTKLVGIGAAAILLATGLIGRRLVRPPQAALWWSLFIFWGALSAVWAVDTEEVLLRLPMAVSLLFLYLVVVSVNVSEEELSSVYLFTILGGIVASACTIFFYQSGVFYEGSGRASLVFGEREANPNTLSFSLVLPIGLGIYRYTIASRLWKKMLYLVAITVMAAGFFLTMSRGPLLGLVIFLLMYSAFSRGPRKLTIPLVLLVLALVAMPEVFYARLNLIKDPTGAGRLDIWQDGWLLVQDYWTIGAGLSNYPVVEHRLVGAWRGAHNIYLTSLVELGIIGFSFLVLALWSNLRRPRSILSAAQDEPSRRDGLPQIESLIEAVSLGLLAAAFFQDVIWRKAFWFAWMLIILAWHANRLDDKTVALS